MTYYYYFIIFTDMKHEQKKISVTLDKNLLNKLDESNYNKSKLIDSLLTKHFKNKSK